MKKILIMTALAAFALTPVLGSACEYEATTDAKATQPEQLAATPVPQASQAPTSSALKQLVPSKAVKPVVEKSKQAAPQAKPVVVSSTN